MRTVALGPAEGAAPPQIEEEIQRRARHLRHRMEEFMPDGMQVICEIPTQEGWGRIKIRVPGVDSHRAQQILHQKHRIESCPVEGDMLVFLVTDRASFEDMDYVQGAVTGLFYL